ncbi:MAG: type II toxin-antitoxin system YafQ family toxin [Proteobacteria bacterium]|nr:type II toxin-antitoxin system YafQ family toxin [Pseudomonadota bacterium]
MNISYTTRFKKDYKRIKKQNKNLDKLRSVIETLASGKKLEQKFRDHQLSGTWSGHRNCHIESDWILIYRVTAESDLFLERTGSHSELFKK